MSLAESIPGGNRRKVHPGAGPAKRFFLRKRRGLSRARAAPLYAHRGQDPEKILEKCRRKGLGIASHVRHRYLLQGRFLTTAGLLIYGKDAKGVYCVRDMEEFIRRNDCEVEEFQFYFLLPGAKEKVRAILKDYPSLYAAYTGIYVEVYSKHASKGNALAALAGHLGIGREEIACIGDGENDLSMFASSGLRIAMGNAVDMLKVQADHVTESNDRDGAARAIERYVL